MSEHGVPSGWNHCWQSRLSPERRRCHRPIGKSGDGVLPASLRCISRAGKTKGAALHRWKALLVAEKQLPAHACHSDTCMHVGLSIAQHMRRSHCPSRHSTLLEAGSLHTLSTTAMCLGFLLAAWRLCRCCTGG